MNMESPMLGHVSILELGKCPLTHCFPKHIPEATFVFFVVVVLYLLVCFTFQVAKISIET